MSDKIMIAMSGGVDSSVTAYLCMQQNLQKYKDVKANGSANVDDDNAIESSIDDANKAGSNVIDNIAASIVGSGNTINSNVVDGNTVGSNVAGATMKLMDDYDPSDAEKIADTLGIPFYVFDFREQFESCVIKPFIDTYSAGATPNPCVECNRFLKFDLFYERMRELGYDKLATGHYARVEYSEKYQRFVLKKALNLAKDQSYVLYSLTQAQLENTYFPLGEMSKEEVREIASLQGFENANKKESQDICFVPDGDYSKYIEEHTDEKFPEGDFVDLDGNVLGRHKGIIRYTIGQRKGLGLALPQPMYVCRKDVEENKVVLCLNDELFKRTVIADNINLMTVDRIHDSMDVKAKIRYNQVEQSATVTQPDEDTLKIVFDEPQRAIAKGQSVVMYDGDIVVGGGTILNGY